MAENADELMARVKIRFRKAIGSIIPQKCANKAVEMFKRNFNEEGFFGARWKEVQRRTTHTISYTTKKGKRVTRTVGPAKGVKGQLRILTGTGNLGRSIRYRYSNGEAEVYSDLPYSRAHNDGTKTAGRRRRTVIPRSQFMGEHPILTKEMKEIVEREVMKALDG